MLYEREACLNSTPTVCWPLWEEQRIFTLIPPSRTNVWDRVANCRVNGRTEGEALEGDHSAENAVTLNGTGSGIGRCTSDKLVPAHGMHPSIK